MAIQNVTNLVLAPSNEEAIFVRTMVNPTTKQPIGHIFHIHLATDVQTQWTFTDEWIDHVAWSPNGQSIAFLSGQQLHIINKQLERRLLSDIEVDSFYWHPCGEKLWVNSKKSASIVVVHIIGGQVQPFMKGVEQSVIAIAHNGQQIVVRIKQDAFYLVNVQTEQYTLLTEEHGQITQVAFSFSDQYIAYIGRSMIFDEATQPALYVHDTALSLTQNLTEMLDAPVGDFAIKERMKQQEQKVIWTETDALYFTLSDMGDVRLYYADLYGSIFPASPEQEHVLNYSIAPSGNWALMTVSTPTMVEELFFIDITTGDRRQLTTFNEQQSFVAAQPIVIDTENGDLHGWVMPPANRQHNKTYPIVIQQSDAPYKMFANTFYTTNQRLIKDEIGILYVNTRGSYGYSQAFARAINGRALDQQAIERYVKIVIDWVDETQIMFQMISTIKNNENE